MEVRPLETADVELAWNINEQGLPGTGKVSLDELSDILSLCEYAIGAFESQQLLGFVLCLAPGTRYGSLNYGWFNERYSEFLYVDRIAVGLTHRDRGIGSMLYNSVFLRAGVQNIPVVAEVNRTPPNPGSLRFHKRHGFEQVGEFHQDSKSVVMLLRRSK